MLMCMRNWPSPTILVTKEGLSYCQKERVQLKVGLQKSYKTTNYFELYVITFPFLPLFADQPIESLGKGWKLHPYLTESFFFPGMTESKLIEIQ